MQIERNALCPCGSGKKFKKCCIDMNYNYQYLGNSDLIVNNTLIKQGIDSLCDMIECTSQFNSLDEILDFYISILKSADNITKFYSMYTKCLKGCCHCCNIKVSINYLEFLIIKRYIESLDKETQQIILSNLNLRKKTHSLYFNDLFSKNIKDKDYKMDCIFLHNNQCTIYPVRPIVCRTWLSVSDPILCIEDASAFHPNLNLLVEILFSFSEELQKNNPNFQNFEFHNFIPLWFKDIKEF